MWDQDDDLGYYGPFDGWPEPPRRSEYGLFKTLLDGMDFGSETPGAWDDGDGLGEALH